MTEHELRAWVASGGGLFARTVVRRGEAFAPRPLPIAYLGFGPAPGGCLAATRELVAAREGLRAVVGYAGPPKGEGAPLAHVWAADASGLVDVAWHNAGTAYLGLVVPIWQLNLLWSSATSRNG